MEIPWQTILFIKVNQLEQEFDLADFVGLTGVIRTPF